MTLRLILLFSIIARTCFFMIRYGNFIREVCSDNTLEISKGVHLAIIFYVWIFQSSPGLFQAGFSQ